MHSPLFRHTSAAAPPVTTQQDPSEAYTRPNNGFDANVVMVLSVLLCALVCSLGLNVIVRCALRCSRFVTTRDEAYDNHHHHLRSTRLANTGIKKKALKTFPTVNYSGDLKMPGLGSECVICLSEFAPGERLRILPKCNHGFHVRCIDKWLNSHSSCPTCRHCLIETCQKILGCDRASGSQPPITPQETVIDIAPLEREDMIHN